MRSLWAKINLAWALFLHFLKKPFQPNGYQTFLDNYRADRLVPLTQEDKTWLLRFSKCFN